MAGKYEKEGKKKYISNLPLTKNYLKGNTK